jgi:ERCC4-related helicase
MAPESSAAILAPGMRVECRDAEWMVRRVESVSNASNAFVVHCLGSDDLVRGHEASFLTDLDKIKAIDPRETTLTPDDSAGFKQAKLYLEAQLRTMPITSEEPDFKGMGVFDAMHFQAESVKLALKQPRVRLLLADAVGLGKTIQVGMILSELQRRGRARRVLVLAKKSMLAQFQSELWNRFTIPLTRLDSRAIQKLRLQIPASKNPFEVFYKIIISIDTLKDIGRYRHFLEQTKWDVVVIDEAHNVAGASVPEKNKSYRLARLLARRAENLLLTTATPHNGKPETFGRLISLLQPAAIGDPDLKTYDAEEIKGYFLMRFKEDVRSQLAGHLPERQVIPRPETTEAATEAEEQTYALLATMREQVKAQKGQRSNHFMEYTLYKLFLSSPESCKKTLEKRLKKKEELDCDEVRFLQDLQALLKKQTIQESARFQALLKALNKIGWNGKGDSPRVVIFTQYLETQRALFEALTAHFKIDRSSTKPEDQAGQAIGMMHGAFNDAHLMDVVESFGTGKSKMRMLLATDVASEGLNLHHECNQVIHYDLPWSIITLIQRTGRIDRYGQKKTPVLRYLMVDSQEPRFKGDAYIFEKLIEKVEQINHSRQAGDSVLALYDEKEEERYIAEKGLLAGDLEVLENPASADHASFENTINEVRTLSDLDLAAMWEEVDEVEEKRTAYKVDTHTSRLRLFNDLTFFTEGYNLLASQNDYPTLEEKKDLVRLTPPADLARYLGLQDRALSGATAIPQEAIQEDQLFRLTGKVTRVQEAIEAAQQQRGLWANETLCTDQHPIAQWVVERLLMSYPRGQAPYIVVDTLAPKELCFCFVGHTSTDAGTPHWVEAHTVVISPGGTCRIEALDATAHRVGFDGLINRGTPAKIEAARACLHTAVEASLDYLKSKQQERNALLAKKIVPAERQLKAWRRKREAFLQEKIATLPPQHKARRKAQDDLEALEHYVRDRKENWLKSNYISSSAPTTIPVLVLEGTSA